MIATMIGPGTTKRPADLVMHQINGPMFRPSGRQDLNLRPLDPQSPLASRRPAPIAPLTC